MKKRQIITIAFFIISSLFISLFALSKVASIHLSIKGTQNLILAGVVITSVISVVAGLNDIWDLVKKAFDHQIFQQDEVHEAIYRKKLMEKVSATWIEGALTKALYKSAWIELGMILDHEKVDHPLNLQWQSKDHNHILYKDIPISTIFREKAASTLLILGEPGSGKTVMLLELARQLIEESEKRKIQEIPIPIVLNLSTWAIKREKLYDWLLAELDINYDVPKHLGEYWLYHDSLLLLLDGLDEVAEDHRQSCVNAINRFRQKHGLTGMVVCSRIEEYEALTDKLKLLGAVVIQPLTISQAEDYLMRIGNQVRSVQMLLKEDDILQRWVRSPLFLYVVAIAYRGLTLRELRRIHSGSLERLYDIYVEQMLASS